MRRRSKRIKAKAGKGDKEATPEGKGAAARRVSVGGELGLTPAKASARNLELAKAEESAIAAAARLDDLNAGEQRGRQRRKGASAVMSTLHPRRLTTVDIV